MNTNSTQETPTAKAKGDLCAFGVCAFGNYDDKEDKYTLFTLPEGHVVYVIDKEDGHWSWFEEHVITTEVQINSIYSKMTIYTQEGKKYTLEVDAFTTVQGAMAACESRETFDMQQHDIDHLNEIINLKESKPHPDD